MLGSQHYGGGPCSLADNPPLRTRPPPCFQTLCDRLGLGLWRYGVAGTLLELALLKGAFLALRSTHLAGLGPFCLTLAALQVLTEAMSRLPLPPSHTILLLSTGAGYVAQILAARRVKG
jgi:hypothetical protein